MKIKLKGFLAKAPYNEELQFVASDMSEYGFINVGPIDTEIDYDIQDGWNPVAAEVAMLEKQLAKLSDEHMNKVRKIRLRINDLLCIENNPSNPSEPS